MLGIVVCTHAKLAQGLKSAAEMIAGAQPDFDAVGFYPGDDMLELAERLKIIAQGYEDRGQPYVFLADLPGATPFNASAVALAELNASVITGANLPLLLELIACRDSPEPLEECLSNAVAGAQMGVKLVRMRDMFQK